MTSQSFHNCVEGRGVKFVTSYGLSFLSKRKGDANSVSRRGGTNLIVLYCDEYIVQSIIATV